MSGPLTGVRVLDLTSVLMGPYATQLLADLGAEVIKLEALEGDTVRGVGPMRNEGMGHIFLHANRNKKSVAVDLKTSAGIQILFDLARDVDVLVYNIRPSAMKRLGITYENLCAINPRIIFAGLYGYSETGPYAGRAAYDDLIQGATAVPWIVGQATDGEPRYVPLTLADRTVALMAANAITAALVAQQRTGKGQQVEISMFETMLQFVLGDHLAGLTFDPPVGPPGYRRLLSPHRKPHRTADGFICLLLYSDKQWRAFFELIGRTEQAATDPRLASISQRSQFIDELYAMVGQELKTRTTSQWLGDLQAIDVPCMPVNTIEDLLEDPQVLATGMIRSVDHPTQGRIRQLGVPVRMSETTIDQEFKPAPELGRDTQEVMRTAGYSDQQIAELARDGVIFDMKEQA